MTGSFLYVRELSAENDGLQRQIERFRAAIAGRSPERDLFGRMLYSTLFHDLEPELASKTRWYLVLDDSLFDLPFSALVTGSSPGAPRYLVEEHSLITIPGAWIFNTASRPTESERMWDGVFVGVGDPIYNRADPRHRPASWFHILWRPTPRMEFARLAGSSIEVERCARRWGKARSRILQGPEAGRLGVQEALGGGPSVLHFATHVVRAADPGLGASLVLSLGPDGDPDLLGPQEVSRWRFSCPLVVLDGCDSAAGQRLPGSGMMGLTRSWLIGGARIVAATHWPTADDTGGIFEAFYENLAKNRKLGAAAPAESLRSAQIAMLRENTWRSDPRYWAAYFLIGKR